MAFKARVTVCLHSAEDGAEAIKEAFLEMESDSGTIVERATPDLYMALHHVLSDLFQYLERSAKEDLLTRLLEELGAKHEARPPGLVHPEEGGVL